MQFSFWGLWIGGCAAALPPKLHFHEVEGRTIDSLMGVAYEERLQVYRALYVVDGAVAQATSPDLVNWNRETLWAVEPEAGCAIDGGSIYLHEGEHLLYYSETCCSARDGGCATSIRRATSVGGYLFVKRDDPVIDDIDLVMPSVVYAEDIEKWVMTLVAPFSGRYSARTPTFYHSQDGLNWHFGGEFPDYTDRFLDGYPTLLMPYGGAWALIGTPSWSAVCSSPEYYYGTLNPVTGVLEATYEDLSDIAWKRQWRTCASVWGHQETNDTVMIALSTPFDRAEMGAFSFPLALRPPTRPLYDLDPQAAVEASFLRPLGSLVIPGDEGDELLPGLQRHLYPSSTSPDGLYWLHLNVDDDDDDGLDGGAVFEIHFINEDGTVILRTLLLIPPPSVGFPRFEVLQSPADGYDVIGSFRHRDTFSSPSSFRYIDIPPSTYRFIDRPTIGNIDVIFDGHIMDMNIGGRGYTTDLGGKVSYVMVDPQNFKIRQGWRFDPLQIPDLEGKPVLPNAVPPSEADHWLTTS